jgi:hypothetical protein
MDDFEDGVENDDSKFSFDSDAIDEALEDVKSCDENSVDDLNESSYAEFK